MPAPLDNILEILGEETHPEIRHIRRGTHPGSQWWLKTICPDPQAIQLDREGWGAEWFNLSRDLRHVVHLTPIAYDWEGNKIAWTMSVWLRQDVDAVIIDTGSNTRIDLVERVVGERNTVQQLREVMDLITEIPREHIEAAIESLESRIPAEKPDPRKKFRVIRNEQIDSANTK